MPIVKLALIVTAGLAIASCAQTLPSKLSEASSSGGQMELCGITFHAPAISPALPGTPAAAAAFLGQWGDGWEEWSNGLVCGAIIVTAVQPSGAAEVLKITGRQDLFAIRGGVKLFNGTITGDTLTIEKVDTRFGVPAPVTETYRLAPSGKEVRGAESEFHRYIVLPKSS